jgi:type I restriction enzyme S subunit
MQFGIYDNLKSSGSEWLGDIPKHWDVKKLKFLAVVQPSNVDKKTVEGEESVILCNYTDVYKNEYIDGRLDFMRASATAEEIKKFGYVANSH